MPWVLLNIPAVVMVIGLLINSTFYKIFLSYFGWIALSLFIFLLTLNPYLKIFSLKFPKITKFVRFCNRFRSELGVSSFFYACLHFTCFIIKRGSIKETLPFLLHPALIPGLLSLLLLLTLSLTSNKYSIKKMGFANWKKLHTKVYVIEWLLIIHLIFLKHIYLVLFFIPLLFLQYFRRKKSKAERKV